MENTVVFDVGGRIFKVRRSLLDGFPSTVLARSVSTEWNEADRDKPIFIDRDPERFRFVLDYMRDNCIRLPHTESQAALLAELDYLGFTNVQPDTISIEFSTVGAVNHVHAVEAKMRADLENAKEHAHHMELALMLFKKYKEQGECSFSPHVLPLAGSNIPLEPLNAHLAKYGFQCTITPYCVKNYYVTVKGRTQTYSKEE